MAIRMNGGGTQTKCRSGKHETDGGFASSA
jgi:hypothetical protein